MNRKFWQKRNIIITGANGFVGSSLLYFFENNNVKVIGAVKKILSKNKGKKNIVLLDVLNRKKLHNICQEYKIDMIIHCAALDGNSEYKKNNIATIVDENTRMTLNILEVAKAINIKDLVIMSSSKVYTHNLKDPLDSHSAYATSKIICEMLSNIYASNYNLNIFLPRPCNIYGPDDSKADKPGRVVQTMIKKILSHQKIEIWGDGKQKKQFIYIDDFNKILIKMIETNKYHTLNIGNPQAMSIDKLAATIINILDEDTKRVIYKKNKLPFNDSLVINLKEQQSLIDFKLTPIVTGLKKTINYYEGNGK